MQRTALVTGASSGLGLRSALRLMQQGFRVVGCHRAQGEYSATPFPFRMIACDVTSKEQVLALVHRLEEEFGYLDAILHAAGGAAKMAGWRELTSGDWQDSFHVNVTSVAELTALALPLLERSTSARVLTISSTAAHKPGRLLPHYSAAKAALENLTRHLALELAPKRITVNALCVGPVRGDSWQRNLARFAKEKAVTPEEADQMLTRRQEEKIPLGRMGTEEEVAAAAAFLLSPEASWITGAIIPVDGGLGAT